MSYTPYQAASKQQASRAQPFAVNEQLGALSEKTLPWVESLFLHKKPSHHEDAYTTWRQVGLSGFVLPSF
jgi:hypothetical protein